MAMALEKMAMAEPMLPDNLEAARRAYTVWPPSTPHAPRGGVNTKCHRTLAIPSESGSASFHTTTAESNTAGYTSTAKDIMVTSFTPRLVREINVSWPTKRLTAITTRGSPQTAPLQPRAVAVSTGITYSESDTHKAHDEMTPTTDNTSECERKSLRLSCDDSAALSSRAVFSAAGTSSQVRNTAVEPRITADRQNHAGSVMAPLRPMSLVLIRDRSMPRAGPQKIPWDLVMPKRTTHSMRSLSCSVFPM
mmetsp:Transcript_1991/g.5666  ORF Transcript_1991/g.5666 Transcript_1991/m.5666 type:complete len:250 (+) Transcript_1991:244-993(+)